MGRNVSKYIQEINAVFAFEKESAHYIHERFGQTIFMSFFLYINIIFQTRSPYRLEMGVNLVHYSYSCIIFGLILLVYKGELPFL